MKQKALIYIGGSGMQCCGIEAARAAGLWTVVTDINTHAAGRPLADHFELLSATDIVGQLALAARIDHEFDLVGVYGVADYAYEAVGAIAARHGLPIGSPQEFAIMADKADCHEALDRAEVEVPRQITLQQPDARMAADQVIERLKFPVVVKPANDCNSRGVHSVFNPDISELAACIEAARAFNQRILVESMVDGIHFNVDGLMCEDTFIPVAITERNFVDNISHVALSGFQGNHLERKVEVRLWDAAERAAGAVGRHSGPVTVDIVDSVDGPIVLEVSPHFHCIMNTHLRGSSAIGAWFALLAGHPDWRATLPTAGNEIGVFGYLNLYGAPNCSDWSGLRAVEKLRREGMIVHLEVQPSAMEPSRSAPKEGEFVGVVFLEGDSRETFFSRADKIMGAFAALGQHWHFNDARSRS